MAETLHHYAVRVRWTGNTGRGTVDHAGYDRAFTLDAGGKPAIAGSSDPAFRGDPARWNPEELFLASLSACHKLWYLALCAGSGVVVTGYEDEATATMIEEASGAGQFASVLLHPQVTIAPGSDEALAAALHDRAHAMCFIARSVAVPVTIRPAILREAPGS